MCLDTAFVISNEVTEQYVFSSVAVLLLLQPPLLAHPFILRAEKLLSGRQN